MNYKTSRLVGWVLVALAITAIALGVDEGNVKFLALGVVLLIAALLPPGRK